jgi:hypothetical protein
MAFSDESAMRSRVEDGLRPQQPTDSRQLNRSRDLDPNGHSMGET